MKCRECDKPARTAGLCGGHYYRSLSNTSYEFTPRIWDKWWAARHAPADQHTLRLREGIRQFRELLERP